MLVHINDEKAVIFTLLVNAIKIIFLNQPGDGLIGQERARRKGRDGSQVKFALPHPDA